MTNLAAKPKKIRGLLAATLLIATIPSAFCGDATDVSKSVNTTNLLQEAAAANPLCFLDGQLCFDLQERVRFEIREDNYSFNDSVTSPNDGSWLLQRFRIGAVLKPVDWLTVYAQGQDSPEAGSARAKIPGALGAEGNDPPICARPTSSWGTTNCFRSL